MAMASPTKDRLLGPIIKIMQRIWEWKQDKPFGILVIGDAGSGKSTLINNILGENVAKVGETTHSETARITCHDGSVKEVDVKIYDTPGLGDTKDDPQVEESHLKNMKAVMDSGEIAMVIFCFKMTETRMSSGNIRTFKTYHNRLHLNWKKVIIALTFADVVPAFKPAEPPAEVYQRKLKEWKDHIGEVLREKVGVAVSDEDLRILPVTLEYAIKLPNKEEWFTPLWLSVMEVLDPHPMFRFLKMHFQNIGPPEAQLIDEKLISDAVNHVAKQMEASQLSSDQLSSDQQSSDQLSSDRQPLLDQQPHSGSNIDLRNPEHRSRLKNVLREAFRIVLDIPKGVAVALVDGVISTWGRLKAAYRGN